MEEKKSLIPGIIQSYFLGRKIKALKKEEGRLSASQRNLFRLKKSGSRSSKRCCPILSWLITLETAFRLAPKYEAFNYVTLNGDYFDQSGVVEGGSAPSLMILFSEENNFLKT